MEPQVERERESEEAQRGLTDRLFYFGFGRGYVDRSDVNESKDNLGSGRITDS